MACSQPGKKLSDAVMDHDIISSLPGEIKEKILIKMPIKDAVKTSILSTKWRYAWASMPEIVLRDNELVPNMAGPEAVSLLGRIVDLVLFLHNGPILKFELSTEHFNEAFDRWILNLSRNGITELTLLLLSASNEMYRIPSSFFHCKNLQSVHLSHCFIMLPSSFDGFELLRTLTFEDCDIKAANLEISSCPQLECLKLTTVRITGNINIHAKELKYLEIVGVFSELQINAPHVAYATIVRRGPSIGEPFLPRGCTNNLCRILNGLLRVKQLGLMGRSIPYLMGEDPVEFPRPFNCLETLTLQTDFSNQKQNTFVFSLLQRSNNLKNLYFVVTMSNIENANFWDEKSNIGFALENLQKVVIFNFYDSEPVLSFVKFILGSANVLKGLYLNKMKLDSIEITPMVLKRLLKFRRASKKAEVIIKEI